MAKPTVSSGEVFTTDSAAALTPSVSRCTRFRKVVTPPWSAGATPASARDLVDDHGFPAHYARARRFVRQLPGPPGNRGAPGHHHGRVSAGCRSPCNDQECCYKLNRPGSVRHADALTGLWSAYWG